jgi:hypothetical protein
MYRQRSSKTGRAEHHRIEQSQPRWKWHDPISGYAHVFSKTTVVRHPHVVAGDHHLIARLETRI